jgi:hypothetical protein
MFAQHGVIGDNFHVKCSRAFRNYLTDAPKSNYAQHFSTQLDTIAIGIAFPFVLPQRQIDIRMKLRQYVIDKNNDAKPV